MAKEGQPISVAKACKLAGLSRLTFYFQAKRRSRRINDVLAAHQAGDRHVALRGLSHRGVAPGREQEFGAADLPTERVAGTQEAFWASPASTVAAIGRVSPE